MNRGDKLNIILQNLENIKDAQKSFEKEEAKYKEKIKQLYSLTIKSKQAYQARIAESLKNLSFSVAELKQIYKAVYNVEPKQIEICVNSERVETPLEQIVAPEFKKFFEENFSFHIFSPDINENVKHGCGYSLSFKLDKSCLANVDLKEAFYIVNLGPHFSDECKFCRGWELRLSDEYLDKLKVKNIDPNSIKGKDEFVKGLIKIVGEAGKPNKVNPIV